MDDDALKKALIGAGQDQTGASRRKELGEALSTAFRAAGRGLWVGGFIVGGDRAAGASPFGFGSDAAVGLATVVQIAGELTGGSVALLEQGNRYAAAALIRQLVEVEYLAWAFAEDEQEARAWMRSTKEERLGFWAPRHIRGRAGDRFRGADYSHHCERGGHPSPEARKLLPDHDVPPFVDHLWWNDLLNHALSAWSYVGDGAERLGCGEELRSLAEARALSAAEDRWRSDDPFVVLFEEARRRSRG